MATDPLPFDPTYGYDLPRLRHVPAPVGPADFAEFWQQTYAQCRQIPLRLECRPVPHPNPAVNVFEVEYNSLDSARIGGWITIPADGNFHRGLVVGHGYGGREAVDVGSPPPAEVTIQFCARGFHRSARPDLPNESSRHVVHGIGDRATYIIRGCVADLWGAASALLELYPAAAKRLHYYGGSFGGGLGALALPWDDRFHKAYLDVPTFGNHPIRVTLPCGGSGEAVRQYYRHHPAVLEVLAYFDAATAARFMKRPVFVAAALADPNVPPPGQFAVYNGLAGPKKLFVRQTGHPDLPADSNRIAEELSRWFAD